MALLAKKVRDPCPIGYDRKSPFVTLTDTEELILILAEGSTYSKPAKCLQTDH